MARALRELPEIFRAFASGLLSWDQLRPLTRFATSETDAGWADRARDMEPGALWLEARRQERRRREQANADHQMRYLRLHWDEGGRFLELFGVLAAEQGAVVERALRRRAEQVVLEDDVLYDRAGARLADALCEMASSGGEGSPVPATVVVHVDADVIADSPPDGRLRLAETEGGIRLADETVRRLVCNSRVEWLLERDGKAVGIGRRARRVPAAMIRALHHRDRGCRFPGCARTSWVNAHHLVPWARGGSTDLGNLMLLCSAHHRLIHEGGWSISGHPEQGLRFHDPTGRPLRTSVAEHAARGRRHGPGGSGGRGMDRVRVAAPP